MVYIGRNSRIKKLKKELVLATAEFEKYRNKMVEGGFKLEDIEEYNRKSNAMGCLQMKIDREEKYSKPQQYMEELSVPKNNR